MTILNSKGIPGTDYTLKILGSEDNLKIILVDHVRILSNLGLTSFVNSAIKRNLTPVIKKQLTSSEDFKSCASIIHKSTFVFSPLLSGALVTISDSYSLSMPLTLATAYVSNYGMPENILSMMQAAGAIALPLLTTKLFNTVSPYGQLGLLVCAKLIRFSYAMYNNDNSNKNPWEHWTNIVEDNTDLISVGTLTYIAATGFGLAATAPVLAISFATALTVSSGYTMYQSNILPSDMDNVYKLGEIIIDPYAEYASDLVECLGDITQADQAENVL